MRPGDPELERLRRPSRRCDGPPLRAADPHGVILVGAISYFLDSLLGDSFLQALIAQHVLPLADGLTVHFYRVGPAESVAAGVGYIRDLPGRQGRSFLSGAAMGVEHLRSDRRRRV